MEFVVAFTPQMAYIMVLIGFILQRAKEWKVTAAYAKWFPYAALVLGIVGCLAFKVPTPIVSGIVLGSIEVGWYEALKGKT